MQKIKLREVLQFVPPFIPDTWFVLFEGSTRFLLSVSWSNICICSCKCGLTIFKSEGRANRCHFWKVKMFWVSVRGCWRMMTFMILRSGTLRDWWSSTGRIEHGLLKKEYSRRRIQTSRVQGPKTEDPMFPGFKKEDSAPGYIVTQTEMGQ